MIRTLYVRVVLTFLIIVIASLAVSTMLVTLRNESVLKQDLARDLKRSGQLIQQLYEASSPVSLDAFLASAAELKQLRIQLVEPDGGVTSFGAESKGVMPRMEGAVVSTTLVTEDGTEYMLRLKPNLEREMRGLQNITNWIVISVLIVGSFLILIAARYLVKPLKQMTKATRQIAGGDFNIHLQTTAKDELGELAASIQQMAGELSGLEQMRQDFVSNVSHEMQSPLTAIGGFAQALRSADVTEEERLRYASIIETESSRLSRLSDNLLRLASLDSEHHPFHVSRIRLDRQLREAVWSCEPLWSAKQLEMNLELDEVRMMADSDLLGQVWTNLIHNAIKFTPQHGAISIHLQSKEGRAVVIVKDSGIGMSEQDQARIFERFFKADSSRNRNRGGNGLGLAITHKIVTLHKGTITVSSRPGEGAEFRVELPAPREASFDAGLLLTGD
ncbi:sensor histidine kinase [Paenibacillus sp. GCM10023252]|uniref:sensor histidine kinase n=1 Tax=Paenibacillus sp. GCM10023252 TaxID=3252649 RepID=UPI003606231B